MVRFKGVICHRVTRGVCVDRLRHDDGTRGIEGERRRGGRRGGRKEGKRGREGGGDQERERGGGVCIKTGTYNNCCLV